MKPDQKVIIIFLLSPILIGLAAAYLLPHFINTQKSFIARAVIVKFASPDTKTPDSAEEYHLWLKLELSPAEFDALFKNNKNENPKNAPIRKDEMKTERLESETMIQDMLVIKGYNTAVVKSDTGLPLSISKYITLAQEKLRALETEESLANPQRVPRQKFQSQTDIYQDTAGDKTLLYIHLESGIKSRATRNQISLTVTHLKDNKAVLSRTLPPFRY